MTNSEECYFCAQRVYVLERISAEGKFFHRSCFACHQCGITLRLGGYTFDQSTGELRLLHHTWKQEGDRRVFYYEAPGSAAHLWTRCSVEAERRCCFNS